MTFLGIDTSNYTTSAALYDAEQNRITMAKRLLPVKPNELGLRQSDAVFAHVKQLPDVMAEMYGMLSDVPTLTAVGVSTRPRTAEGSYMPAFLAGNAVADSIAAAMGIKKHECSHQDGHIAAALYSANALHLLDREFYAFHLSGGTTEAVLVKPYGNSFEVELLAHTLDLNAGQLVDRVGLMLSLQFPCGRALTDLALQCDERMKPRPAFKDGNPHLSGAENQCEKLRQSGATDSYVARYAIEYIKAAVCGMTEHIVAAHGDKPLLYAGGVMSNVIIRDHVERHYGGIFAAPEYSTDNAAGVAILASRIG